MADPKSLTRRILDANLAALVLKQKNGTITTSEGREMLRLSKERDARDAEAAEAAAEEAEAAAGNESSAVRWIVSNRDLCEMFGVTRETIRLWGERGMPRIKHGTYDFRAVFEWWYREMNDPNEKTTSKEIRDRFWLARAEGEEIKLAEIKGALVPWSAIDREWGDRAAYVRSSLLSWSSRLPQLLEGKDLHQMRELLRAEACELLETYCRESKITPKRRRNASRKSVNLKPDTRSGKRPKARKQKS